MLPVQCYQRMYCTTSAVLPVLPYYQCMYYQSYHATSAVLPVHVLYYQCSLTSAALLVQSYQCSTTSACTTSAAILPVQCYQRMYWQFNS